MGGGGGRGISSVEAMQHRTINRNNLVIWSRKKKSVLVPTAAELQQMPLKGFMSVAANTVPH